MAERIAFSSKRVFLCTLPLPQEETTIWPATFPVWILEVKKRWRQSDITFISLICFPEINDSNWFEVEIPQPDAAVSAPGGEALFTGIHAENP